MPIIPAKGIVLRRLRLRIRYHANDIAAAATSSFNKSVGGNSGLRAMMWQRSPAPNAVPRRTRR